MAVTGLSLAACAHLFTDPADARWNIAMTPLKYSDTPPQTAALQTPGPENAAL